LDARELADYIHHHAILPWVETHKDDDALDQPHDVGCLLQKDVVMATSEQGKAPAYKIKRIEPVIKGSDVQARVFTLAPGEAIPWHYHRKGADHYFVLEGILSISTREPDVRQRACPSEAAIGLHPERRI